MSRETERSVGVPRPYASKTLPTPSNVVRKIVSPLKIWQVILLTSVLTILTLGLVVVHTDYGYSSSILGLGGAVATAALGIGVQTNRRSDVKEVPSISDVSRTYEYFKAASRLSVYSIVAPILTLALLIVAQVVLPEGGISRSTRFGVAVIAAVSFIASYTVVKALCSYSSKISSTSLSTPVEVSSIPEIIAVLGFIASPLLVIGAVFYKSTPILYLSFSFTLVDCVAVVIGLTLMYIALIDRI